MKWLVTSMPGSMRTHLGNFYCFFARRCVCTSWFVCAFETPPRFHIVAKSHWMVQWFIQPNQKTGPSPLLTNTDVTPSIVLVRGPDISVLVENHNHRCNDKTCDTHLSVLPKLESAKLWQISFLPTASNFKLKKPNFYQVIMCQISKIWVLLSCKCDTIKQNEPEVSHIQRLFFWLIVYNLSKQTSLTLGNYCFQR